MTIEEYEKKIAILLDDLSSLESYVYDLFNFIPIPLCFISPAGVILETNPQITILSGYKNEELIGESIEKIFKKQEIEMIKRETLEKKSLNNRESIIIDKKGKEVLVEVSTQTRESKGTVIGFFMAIIDLTEIKKSEEEKTILFIRQEALATDAKRKARELEEKTKELQEKIADLGKFHRIAVGRELKMIELKREIQRLKKELGEKK